MANVKANFKKNPFHAQRKAIAEKHFRTQSKMDKGPSSEQIQEGTSDNPSSGSSDSEYCTDSSETIQRFWKTTEFKSTLPKAVVSKEGMLSDDDELINAMDDNPVPAPMAKKNERKKKKKESS